MDSSTEAVDSAIEPGAGQVSRIAPSAPVLAEPDAAEEDEAPGPGESPRNADGEPPAVVPSRVSQIVPVGTAEEGGTDGAARARPSDIVPVDASLRELRAALRQSELSSTLFGTGFTAEDDDEATTVDAGAALTQEERQALAQRVHSSMEQTAPFHTPHPPEPAPAPRPQPVALDTRSAFKQTMLLGPPLRPPTAQVPAPRADADPSAVTPPAGSVQGWSAHRSSVPTPSAPIPSPLAGLSAASDSAAAPPSRSAAASSPSSAAAVPPDAPQEPAVLASLVRVVGLPTQPPPRRVRRAGGASSLDIGNEPDHEAFVLTNPIGANEARRSTVPAEPASLGDLALNRPSIIPGHGNGAYPAHAVNGMGASALSRRSAQNLMLPPPPGARDYEPASSPRASRPSHPPPLRVTIEPPAGLSRTRPPTSRAMGLHDHLPAPDPFAGFVAPPPSLAQRGLVVVVVALAVVGICALVALAFGLLGKAAW